jgi:hypothetical protein
MDGSIDLGRVSGMYIIYNGGRIVKDREPEVDKHNKSYEITMYDSFYAE